MKQGVKRLLTIAGSDSSGGAGIQADLKTFHQFGCFGMSVVTAVTAQNTTGVFGIQAVSAEMVARQLDAVLADIGVDAVKTGMLATPEIVEVLAGKLGQTSLPILVVDPVMQSTLGDSLLEASAISLFVKAIVPLATVITPNLPEAEALAGRSVASLAEMREAARVIHRLGAKNVVIKGGHLKESATDLLFDGREFTEFPAVRVGRKSLHGTGCTFASAIAAALAGGRSVPESVAMAKRYVRGAIAGGFALGEGMDSLNHFVATN